MKVSSPTPIRSRVWQRIFRTRPEDTLPHTVTHQRVYIVPSKRGFAFLITLLLMLIASVNYSLSLGYALCFLLTGLFSATLLHTYRNLAGLRINSIGAHDAFVGESVNFTIVLDDQQARQRHGIRVSAAHSTAGPIHINPAEQTQATLAVRAESRGSCSLGRITLQSDWPLGLWTCWSYLHAHRQALVFPKPEHKPPALPTEAGADEGVLSGRTNTGDVSGLRTYQPGDSIGSIAWKSAARGMGLQSRTFDNEESMAATVLDLQHASVMGLEAKLSRLCAWVLEAEHSRTDYALRLPGLSLETGCGKEQQTRALSALALFTSVGESTV